MSAYVEPRLSTRAAHPCPWRPHLRRWIAAAAVALISVAVIARDYAFPIEAAGPPYVGTTFAGDMSSEFDGANAIARLYLQYLSTLSRIMAT